LARALPRALPKALARTLSNALAKALPKVKSRLVSSGEPDPYSANSSHASSSCFSKLPWKLVAGWKQKM
jgi:hypothetical protein